MPVLIIFVLSLFFTAAADATMYRCTLPDGTVVFGDKPVYLSDEYCQEVKEQEPQNPYKGQPAQRSVSRPASENRKRAWPTPGVKLEEDRSDTVQNDTRQQDVDRKKKPAVISGYPAMKTRATTLVEDYKDARKRRHRESYLIDKQKAMREIKVIKEEKVALLGQLSRGVLSSSQRQEIEIILAEIPE